MIELENWWPVARGAGVKMPRRTREEDQDPAPLPAHVGLWLDRMLAEPYSRERQEWQGRLRLYHVAEKALKPGSAPAADPPAVATYKPLFAAWRGALESPDPGIERRFLTVEAVSRVLLHPASNSTVTDGTILLHHTYGVPYLPGSALKGALRSRLDRLAAGEGEEALRLRGLADEVLGCLKGEEAGGGASLIDFYDALWLPEVPADRSDWSPLALDIVNPHNRSYYTESEGRREPPLDTDDPIPVHRLSLAPGARFLVVAEAPASPELAPWLDWLLGEVLVAALADDGIGAWTSAGYGRLKRLEDPKQPPRDDPPRPPEVSAVSEWQAARAFYEAGPGELTAALANGRRAKASRNQAQELLAGVPPALKATLVEKRKEARVEVKVCPEGAGWRLVALRPPEGGT